jgi:hypothetical protein
MHHCNSLAAFQAHICCSHRTALPTFRTHGQYKNKEYVTYIAIVWGGGGGSGGLFNARF